MELAQVAGPVVADRGPDAHQNDASIRMRTVPNRQQPCGDRHIEGILQTRLVDRDPPLAKRSKSHPPGFDEMDVASKER